MFINNFYAEIPGIPKIKIKSIKSGRSLTIDERKNFKLIFEN